MMIDFDNFVMRHGEGYAQYVVEQAEKANGIRHTTPQPLEDRWNYIFNPTTMCAIARQRMTGGMYTDMAVAS